LECGGLAAALRLQKS
jgi:hypothetical protein